MHLKANSRLYKNFQTMHGKHFQSFRSDATSMNNTHENSNLQHIVYMWTVYVQNQCFVSINMNLIVTYERNLGFVSFSIPMLSLWMDFIGSNRIQAEDIG